MTNSTLIPDNKNFLSPTGFKFSLARAPHLNYNIQEVNLPEISLGIAEQPSPFVKIPLGGNISYGELSVNFIVNEDMTDYMEIRDWMLGLGNDTTFDQYKALSVVTRNSPGASNGIHSDIDLVILNSSYNRNLVCKFVECVPTYLTSLAFKTTSTATEYLTCWATFRFMNFTMELLT